ncbi:MAG: FAD-dependent oxidoreductase [Actinobacteria bacterium ATB1]|nr:FAD-dependent oxidoreductase [Actinobacteria bacterium ATB1]
MHILDAGVVADRYDVVVVGAGIGGLTTAALLGRRGLDTLVVEQHYMPGGCCGAIRRGHVSMDVGATVLYGFGERGLNTHRFVMNELEEDIQIVHRDSIYRLHVGGDTITVWRDFDAFLAELVERFPRQKEALERFFQYAFTLYENTILASDFIVPPTEISPEALGNFAMSEHTADLLSWMQRSSLELFEEFFDDPALVAFLDMLIRTFTYVDAAECPALLSLTLFADNHIGGAYYPAGSPQMLSNRLERAVERYGGEILYRNTVDEILVSDGAAVGVRLADGTGIEAGAVVSDTTVWNLYGGLVRPEHVSPMRLKWAQGFVPTHSNLILYMAVDASVIPPDCRPMEIVIEDPEAVEGHGVTAYLPSLLDPTVAPDGVCSVTITAVSSEKWPRPWEPEYRSEEYRIRKEAAAAALLERVETVIPGIRDHIRVLEIGTPTTLERFTLKNWGNIGGPKQMIGQDLANRPAARTEWANLYMCGDSTVMGLGVLPATTSAVGAANLVLRDRGEAEFQPREFERQFVHIGPADPLPDLPDPDDPMTAERAMRLARECQHCENPACTAACPASIDLVGFLRRVEAGNFAGAARSMRETNPLAAVCGIICPAERYCEKVCVRNDFADGPVRIADIHAWVCGPGTAQNGAGPPNGERAIDIRPGRPGASARIAVVGAGPAGISCAHFLSRLGHDVTIFDRRSRPGGILTHALSPQKFGDDVLDAELRDLELDGVTWEFDRSLGGDLTISGLEAEYDAVFLAPGLGRGRTLEIPGLADERAFDALHILEKVRCDGSSGISGNVLVVGGGSVASDTAVALCAESGNRVTVACLESRSEMPMLASEVTGLERLGVDLLSGWGPRQVEGSVLTLVRCTSVFDGDGHFAPSFDDEQTTNVEFDAVVFAIGQTTTPDLAAHLMAEFDRPDRIPVDPVTQAVPGRPRLYAGGDIARGAGTVVESVADGRRAAAAIHTSTEEPTGLERERANAGPG